MLPAEYMVLKYSRWVCAAEVVNDIFPAGIGSHYGNVFLIPRLSISLLRRGGEGYCHCSCCVHFLKAAAGLRNPLFRAMGCRTLLAACMEAEVPFLDRIAHSREQHYCCKTAFSLVLVLGSKSGPSWRRMKSVACGQWLPLQYFRGHLAERRKCL